MWLPGSFAKIIYIPEMGAEEPEIIQTVGEEMKTVSEKRRTVSFCNILYYSARAGE